MLTSISFNLINSVNYQLCQSQKRQYHLCGDELCARRLPVLDSQDTIDVIRNYMKKKEFPPGDIRRVWLGLYRVNVKINCSRLVWADKKMAFKYSASSMLRVWESTELDSSIR